VGHFKDDCCFHLIESCFICQVVIGIIGGSGIDDPDLLEDRKEVEVHTPFGEVYFIPHSDAEENFRNFVNECLTLG
jgi:purine nucleoside phosphorylase